MQPEPVKDGFGKPIKNEDGNLIYQFDSKGANAALITICRLRGKFRDKAVIDVDLSDRAERLYKILAELQKPGKQEHTNRD